MQSLLISTTNPGKFAELVALLDELPVKLISPKDLGVSLDVNESGDTYAQNAALKARAFADASHILSIADDTGLEVDDLDGLPGLNSARFTGSHSATDAERRALLLAKLHEKPKPWMAHFHCTVAVCTPNGKLLYGDGDCPGEIIEHELGSNGFGYDPIFMLREIQKTMAQLSMDEKNQLSHRARAVRALLPALIQLINQ
jgi:XTP/dITP diphosphohydrolase